MALKETLVCPSCQTANPVANRACSGCAQSLAAVRTARYLDQAEADITRGQYNPARAGLTKADVEMLGLDAAERKNLLLTARAFYLHGLIYYHKGQIDEARAELLLAAQNLTDQTGGETLLANVLNSLGNVEYYREHIEAAVTYYRRSVELAVSVGAHSVAAKAIANLGNISTLQGDLAATLAFYERAIREAEIDADLLHLADIYRLIATVYLKNGPVTQAIAYAEKALALADRIDDHGARCRVISDAGNLYLTVGDLANAERCLSQAYEIAQRTDYRLMQVVNLMYLAELMRQRGDAGAWLNCATRAFNLTSGAIVWRSEAALHLVEYYVSQQEWSHARSYLQYIEDTVRLNSFEGDRVHLNHARALLHAAFDDWQAAAENYEAAIAALTEVHDLIGAAALEQEYAAMLLRRASLERDPTVHAHARAVLEQAATAYRRLGLAYRLTPLESLLNHQQSNLLNRLKNIRQPQTGLL